MAIKKIKLKEKRCWSKLETNLLCSINFRLFGADRIRFNAVCKSWSSIPSEFFNDFSSPTKPKKILQFLTSMFPAKRAMEILQFPTLMFSAFNNTSDRKFFNPLLNTTYRFIAPELHETEIHFSKGGWLLVYQGSFRLFFFNPFTEEKIKLPDLPHLPDEKTPSPRVFAFSTLPTLPDCVVIAVKKNNSSWAGIDILYIRRGEAIWKSIKGKIPYVGSQRSGTPVFFDGAFYFLTQGEHEERRPMYSNPNLGRDHVVITTMCIFNPTNKDSNVLWAYVEPKPRPMKFDCLVECEGELMGIVDRKMNVYKLDRATMAWERVKDLGDEMLFLSPRTLLPFSASAKGEFKGMRNKIYSPKFVSVESQRRFQDGVFYSLSTENFHSLGLMTRSLSFEEMGGDSVWIQPCLEKHFIEELTWC